MWVVDYSDHEEGIEEIVGPFETQEEADDWAGKMWKLEKTTFRYYSYRVVEIKSPTDTLASITVVSGELIREDIIDLPPTEEIGGILGKIVSELREKEEGLEFDVELNDAGQNFFSLMATGPSVECNRKFSRCPSPLECSNENRCHY